MGLCYELELNKNKEYLSKNPLRQLNNVLGLILAINMTDTTYGWHGYRSGLALYYYHWSQPQSEYFELSLTSEMTLAVELMMKKTELLGQPYMECSRDLEANHCYRKLTETKIKNQCDCYYGLIHNEPQQGIR